MRKRSCIVVCNSFGSIGSIDEPLLILIWVEGSFQNKPILSLCLVWKKIEVRIWGGGIMVQLHVIWSVNLLQIIYKMHNLYLRKIKLVSYFPDYNLYFHLPIIITSGRWIIISINFTRIETFIPFYMSVSTVGHYLLSSKFHSTIISENFGSTHLTTMIVSNMNNL